MIVKNKDNWSYKPDPEKVSKFKMWMIWLPVAVLMFGGMFLYGYNHILDEISVAPIEGFTADEGNQMVARVQSDFSEEIAYQTSEATGPHTLATGEEYYTVFFVVTTQSDPNVYKYVFWKYAADFEDHKKGDLVLYFRGITDEYTKEDILTDIEDY